MMDRTQRRLSRRFRRIAICLAALVCAIALLAVCGHSFLAAQLPARERTVFINADGKHAACECYSPESGGRHPLVVLLYGSGAMAGGGAGYRWYASTIAQAGYIVVIVPYFQFTPGQERRTPRRTVIWSTGVREAITDLGRQPDIDVSRVGLLGFSMGGNVGLETAAKDSRAAALVDFFGPLPNLSAQDYAHFPPTLILHGTKDHRVPISNARTLDARLTADTIEHQLVIYPGQGHGFWYFAALDAHSRTIAFLKAHLKRK